MAICTKHYQAINPDLGYCWKCLGAERDPPDITRASWWWQSGWQAYCHCPKSAPSANYDYCLRCGLPLSDIRVLGQAA